MALAESEEPGETVRLPQAGLWRPAMREAGGDSGNTPPRSGPLSSYVDPKVVDAYEEGVTIRAARATYTATRRTEPRIAAQVWSALGDARTVLNVGAGTGSYEPSDRDVTAVEPSEVMRAHRPAGAAPCVAATAERLPFEDQSFDAAMAFATIHHWQDPFAGLREMQRVARRVVVFTCDTSDRTWRQRFWLTRDYLPEVASLRACSVLASLPELAGAIGARMEPVLIPWDCADGFFEAYWRRPEAYLDERVRRGISGWALVGPGVERRAVRGLRDDLASGRWAERNGYLLDLEAAELGLRLLIA